MATLITTDDIKEVVPQLAGTTEYDTALDAICARVQAIIERYLGFGFDGYTSATDRVVYGNGTPYLALPPHEAGSVTAVRLEGITDAVDTTLYAEESTGSALYLTGVDPYSDRAYWRPLRYVVTANWGYGTGWPDDVKEVAIELAANIFEEAKTGHFSDIKGVQGDGGAVAVGYAGALTKRQKMILNLVKRAYGAGLVVA